MIVRELELIEPILKRFLQENQDTIANTTSIIKNKEIF